MFSELKGLPSASRKFLLFSGLNLISWQCIVGQFLVLFGRAIGMPASWVGMLLSIMPLSMVLVIISVPIVETYGSRKLMLTAWFLRNAIALPVLAIPFISGYWSNRTSWYILIFSTLGFSLIRAIGVGAWFPWLHEIVPKKQIGSYFSIEAIWTQILNVAVTLGIARVLSLNIGMNRFYWVYTTGIAAGLISVWYMRSIPGGLKTPASVAAKKFTVMRHALANKKFGLFILFALISMASVMWLSISAILYLRDSLQYTESRIMVFLALGSIGVAVTMQIIARKAEKIKSQYVLAGLMAGHAVVAFCWLGLGKQSPWTAGLSLPIIIAGTIVNAGFLVFASRGMMSLIPAEDRVGYTLLWIIGTALGNGIPPILAGWIIASKGIEGYHICFLVSGIGSILASVLWSLFNIDDSGLTEDIHLMVRPQQPLRSLQRLVWVALGIRHDKN